MKRIERKRGSRGAAPFGFTSVVKSLYASNYLYASAHHLAHALFLGNALGDFLLELSAEFRGLPHRTFLGYLRGRVPSLHDPDVAHADPEHFTMDVFGVVAREPRDQRRHVRGRERIPFASLLRHPARSLRSRVNCQSG